VPAIALTALTACSTVDIHEPVGCLDYPELPKFTDDDLSCLGDESYDKLLTILATLKARHDSQCIINEAHDEIHSKAF